MTDHRTRYGPKAASGAQHSRRAEQDAKRGQGRGEERTLRGSLYGLLTGVLMVGGAAWASASWDEATAVQLSVAGDIGSEPIEYRIEMFSEGDARITVVDRDVPNEQRSTIVLVAGQVMLVQNLELAEGYEIDALDAPVLMFQLVLEFLARGVEAGSESVTPEGLEVEVAEETESIEVSTTSAGGEFPAPWRLSGNARRESDERIAFAFGFVFTAGAEEAKMEISGWWERKEPHPELDPEMSLDGWSSYLIGPIERQYSDSTIYDFGAQPRSFRARTLRELRQEISELD